MSAAVDAAYSRLLESGVVQPGQGPDAYRREMKVYENLHDLVNDSPATLEEVVTHILSAGDQEQRQWGWVLRSWGIQKTLDYPEDSGAFRLRMAAYPLILRLGIRSPGLSDMEAPDEMISYCNFLSDENYGERYSNTKALILYSAVHGHMEWITNVEAELDDRQKGELKYISENMDALESLLASDYVLKQIAERKSLDIGFLKLLTETHPAITEGNL